MKEASLLFCLPDNPYFLPKSPGSNAVQEATYACASIVSNLPTPVNGMSLTLSVINRLWLGVRTTLLQSTRSCVPSAQERVERERSCAC